VSYPPATKQVIVIRTDLDMSPGKMIAQGIHATLRDSGSRWHEFDEGNVCIVCRVSSESKLLNLAQKAIQAGIPYGLQEDGGRTEVSAGTFTALSLGPVSEGRLEALNNITRRLQLL
jgi:PTH2 family peptidyl-tRNA hydrolase